jgi:hypothetical protein
MIGPRRYVMIGWWHCVTIGRWHCVTIGRWHCVMIGPRRCVAISRAIDGADTAGYCRKERLKPLIRAHFSTVTII